MVFYRHLPVSETNQEMTMKRSNRQEQIDLFNEQRPPPAMTTLQLHHKELVDLVGRLLREAVQGATTQASKEKAHEQDQC